MVKDWKKTCVSSLLVLMTATRGVFAAGDGFDFPRNTFDLRRVFSRPFLQKKPVPDFREPVSVSEEFKKDRRSAAVPEQDFERASEADLYRDDADDFMTDTAMQRTNTVEENRDVFRLVQDTLPFAEKIEDSYVRDAERSDALATNMMLTFESARQMREMLDEQDDFMMKITGQALIDREYKIYDAKTADADKTAEETVLSLAEDVAPFETEGLTVKNFVLTPESFEGQSLLNYDRMIIFQQRDDVVDISRNVDFSKDDWALWLRREYEQNLDLIDETDMIPEEEPVVEIQEDENDEDGEEPHE